MCGREGVLIKDVEKEDFLEVADDPFLGYEDDAPQNEELMKKARDRTARHGKKLRAKC